MRSRAPAKRRSPPAATSSTPSRSNSSGWSRPCGGFSLITNEARPSPPRPGYIYRVWQGARPLPSTRGEGPPPPPPPTAGGGRPPPAARSALRKEKYRRAHARALRGARATGGNLRGAARDFELAGGSQARVRDHAGERDTTLRGQVR